MRYLAQTDEELVALSQMGYGEAATELVTRYEDVCVFEAREWGNIGLDLEDRVMEARIKLVEAVRTYATGNGSTFKSWAKLLIRNRFRDLYRQHHTRTKGERGVAILSLDAKTTEDGDPLLETIAAPLYDPTDRIDAEGHASWLGDLELVKGRAGQPVLMED